MRPLDHHPIRSAALLASQDAAERAETRGLRIAFGAALALHVGAALGLTHWEPDEPIDPPGEMVVTIDLSPAAMQAESTGTGDAAASTPQVAENPPEKVDEKAAEETPPEPVKEEVKEPPPPEPVPPEPVKEPLPPEPVEPELAPADTALEAPKAEEAPVVVAPPKTAKPKPVRKVEQKKTPPPSAAQAAGATATQRSDVAGSGARATPSEINKYVARIRAAIERRKRFPPGAAEGTAYIALTITRSGGVTGLRLTKSSGSAALDAAARTAVSTADIPPIPEGLPASINLGVPVTFQKR